MIRNSSYNNASDKIDILTLLANEARKGRKTLLPSRALHKNGEEPCGSRAAFPGLRGGRLSARIHRCARAFSFSNAIPVSWESTVTF
jgi:hypothetical protein